MRKLSWLPAMAALSVLTPFALVGAPAAVSAQGVATPDVKPEPAQTILDAAYKKAKAERKPLLVMFHATW